MNSGTIDVDVAITPYEVPSDWYDDRVCIVIDVIRASSTIVALFDQGCSHVYTAASIEEAKSLAASTGCLLGGERSGVRIPGFDFGNSPSELKNLNLRGEPVVLTTTNGTRAVEMSMAARSVLVGCFRNAKACCRVALRHAFRHKSKIGIVCAGKEERMALDDVYCAGYMLRTLQDVAHNVLQARFFSDAAQLALKLYEGNQEDIVSFLTNTASGLILQSLHEEYDISFCGTTNVSNVVPTLTERNPACFCSAYPDETEEK